ncbi:Phosphatidylinositol 4-kinase gamma 4 [Diplonema papillatum]|nr:Phosphatidylinositol 4-kinase gamma 4 [Diplonema papillatum]
MSSPRGSVWEEPMRKADELGSEQSGAECSSRPSSSGSVSAGNESNGGRWVSPRAKKAKDAAMLASSSDSSNMTQSPLATATVTTSDSTFRSPSYDGDDSTASCSDFATEACETLSIRDPSDKSVSHLGLCPLALFRKAAFEAKHNETLRAVTVDEDTAGGVYLIKVQRVPGREEIIGVFKPCDEEDFYDMFHTEETSLILPFADEASVLSLETRAACCDQPRTTRAGSTPGNGWRHEVAAFALDHASFARVPVTIPFALPRALFPSRAHTGEPWLAVVGSLQAYAENTFAQSWDSPPGRFSASDARRIAILDLRLLNCDRHGGNVLLEKPETSETRLIPIDHGYTLPASGLVDLDFEWLLWPQSRTPFTEDEKAYITTCFDRLEDDVDTLRRLGIDDPRILELFKVACYALQAGAVQHNATACGIGNFFRRQSVLVPSALEYIVDAARSGSECSVDFEYAFL